MKEIYDAKQDKDYQGAYIDMDEIRKRKLNDGSVLPFRYMHGGFGGTPIKFSICFPEADRYEGRFYQYLSPFPGPEEELASLPVLGIDDKIAFCITHGAYYVETNMGSGAMFTNSDDNTMTHRSSAMAAEYSREMAVKVYGYEHRPYGYVYGGSGGGYRTIACIENTNAFDGAAPYVIGSPYAIPNCQTTRAHAERLLRNKMPQLIDALDAGGSGDPYAFLNEEQAQAFDEATKFGYPLKSWFASADLNDGALPVLAPGVKGMDPGYFENFWKVPGYLGADPDSSAARERICMDTKIKQSCTPNKKLQMMEGRVDTRNGVNDAWKKMISSSGSITEPWIELEEVPVAKSEEGLYLKGLVIEITSGAAKGRKMQIKSVDNENNQVYLTEGFGMDDILETMDLLATGDNVHLDNSDYIAIQTYHRHQVPSPDYKAWDQFRDEDGTPLYPQEPVLVGPVFCGNGPGCKQDGYIQGKIIICAALLDEQAYPWQADWYRRKIASVHGGNDKDWCRLWYFDNVLHDDITASVDELHATTYIAGLKQALIDLANWVEKGIEPLPSTNYKVDIGHVIVPESAAERGGLQAVVDLEARGKSERKLTKCAHAKVGEPVDFVAEASVPTGAGALTYVEWSFEGETDFPEKGEWSLREGGKRGIASTEHTFVKPGTYFAVVRVKSERNGDPKAPFTQIRNIDRVRIVVEA